MDIDKYKILIKLKCSNKQHKIYKFYKKSGNTMDDIPQLITSLKYQPQPLTEDEERTLARILPILMGIQDKKENFEASLVPPQYTWISEPSHLDQYSEYSSLSTVFDSNSRLVVNCSNPTPGQFRTISEAVEAAKDNDAIYIENGIYTEELNLTKQLHFVANGASLLNCVISVNSVCSFYGFRIKNDGDCFTLLKGQLSIHSCEIEYSGNKSSVFVRNNTTFEAEKCRFSGNRLIEAGAGSVCRVLASVLQGSVSLTKSDSTFDTCMFYSLIGTPIDCVATVLKLKNCIISNSSEIGINCRERSSLLLVDCQVHKISGAGILVHGFSSLRANNVRIFGCDKAGILISHDATAEISGSSIKDCGFSGCEVLNQGSLILNETWVSGHKNSCILSDSSSSITTTRCYITAGSSHGIEAANGSVIRMNDTCISSCNGSAIICSNSKITAATSEFIGNIEPNLILEDHSWLELTNCNILESQSDGLVAESESMIMCNNCFFCKNENFGANIRSCKDIKLLSSTIVENRHGGVIFETTTLVIVDGCTVDHNSFILSHVNNGIIRNSIFCYAWTKIEKTPTDDIVIRNDSIVSLEENKISYSIIKVKHAEAKIRKNAISSSRNFAIQGESKAKIIAESNDMSKVRQALSVKDNSTIMFVNNNVANIIRPRRKDPVLAEIMAINDNKIKAILIKQFSTGTIEGNFISGDYDYAIYVDSQSKADNRANQIQTGAMGGILYTGMSSGMCDDNSFSGKGSTKYIEYWHGCSSTKL